MLDIQETAFPDPPVPSSSSALTQDITLNPPAQDEASIVHRENWRLVIDNMRGRILDGVANVETFGRLAPIIRDQLEGVVDAAILEVENRYNFLFEDIVD